MIQLISQISIFGISTLSITVETSKPSYQVEENIYVIGILTYDGSPVPENLVAIEVQNPDNNTVLVRTRQTNTDGTYNLTFKLPTDAKLGPYAVFVSSSYVEETATDKVTFDLVHLVQTTVMIGGKDYLIIIESNATITDMAATRNSLHFKTSGSAGETAYVNTTFPVGLNKTTIKVFIDGEKITPPPYPIIISNGTHYFIYFEFILSTHEVVIQYAIADIAIANVASSKTVVGEGYILGINTTICNQGHNEETFNVTAFCNNTAIVLPDGKNYTATTLTSGNSTTLTIPWNTAGLAMGNYTMSANATILPGETDTADNIYIDGTILVTFPGDVNGDLKVRVDDILAIALAFGLNAGDPEYDPNLDVNGDGKIRVDDILIAALNFGLG